MKYTKPALQEKWKWMFNIKQARYGTLLSYSFYCLNFQQLFPILKSIVTHCQLIVIIHHSLSIIHKGSLQNKFSDKVGILSQQGFFWPNPIFLTPKPQPYKMVILLGFCRNMAGGSPVPTKTSSQSSVDAIEHSWIANSWIAKIARTARRVSQKC